MVSWPPESVQLPTHTSEAIPAVSLAPFSIKAIDIYSHLCLQQEIRQNVSYHVISLSFSLLHLPAPPPPHYLPR